MPLGNNRRHPEFGKVVPVGCPPERPERASGLGSAMLLSLGLHGLIALWFWHGLVGTKDENPATTRIIDTRVKDPGVEVEVCLKLLEPSKSGPKKESSHRVDSSVQSLPASQTVTDSSKPFSSAAGAESLKPRHNPQGSQVLAGASKTQPRPPESTISSQVASLRGGSLGGSAKGVGTGVGGTSFFQIGTRAKSVVYVIDRSVSMGPNGGLVKAKQELLASLQRMPAESRFQIIIFNRSAEMLSLDSTSGLIPATNENKQQAIKFLASIQPEGGTLPVPALKRALALKPEVIFFLSDGGDWTDRQIQEVISVNRGRAVIHVVDFGGTVRDQLPGPLRTLASKNQGEYRAVSMAGQETWQIRGN